MNFSEAMLLTKNGDQVTRSTWSANNAYVAFIDGDLVWGSKDHPHQHYNPMCDDIFATDWSVSI